MDTIIFDFDGTLADTSRGIVLTEQQTLDRLGLPQVSEESIRSAIGLPLRESLMRGGSVPEEMADEAVKVYRELFDIVAPSTIDAFPGVHRTLAALEESGVKMAIATSRGTRSLHMIVESLGIGRYFSAVVTANDGIRTKPAPDMVLHLLERMDALAEETLVVGDTTFDLDMGSNAHCLTCGVSYGNHSREILQTSSPDFIVDNFPEILSLVQMLRSGTLDRH